MNSSATVNNQVPLTQLQRARALDFPSREAMLHRAPSVQHFWNSNRGLLIDAWHQWEADKGDNIFLPDDTLLDAKMRSAVEQAWQDPNSELAVKDLWEEVSPGVYQAQFFDPEKLTELRRYLDEIADADIPLRPPYGIVLNRRGAMLDPRSEGYLAAPSFQSFYQQLIDKYMRPMARLLFPEIMGYDTQTFGFSIQYQAGMDTSLRLHTDASAVTLNVNLNMPDENFTGSEVDFYDQATRSAKRLTFKPGVAMLHRGNVAHAAQPITSGERTNFVLWLYGNDGQIPYHTMAPEGIDAAQRWSVPKTKSDLFAPF